MQHSLMLRALAPLAEVLDQLQVKWYVCGSVASTIHGVARSTLDVDLVADLRSAHVKLLIESLRPNYYISESAVVDAIARQKSFNAIHLDTSYKIDVFAVKRRAFDQSTVTRIHPATLTEYGEELPVIIASAEDTILNKLEWYRNSDESSERQWQDILGVVRIKGKTLDFDYLQKWASELGIADLLERVKADAAAPHKQGS